MFYQINEVNLPSKFLNVVSHYTATDSLRPKNWTECFPVFSKTAKDKERIGIAHYKQEFVMSRF